MVKKRLFHKFEDKEFEVDKFYEELYWEQIIAGSGGRPIWRIWKYTKESIPCPSCERTTDMEFNIQPHSGVIAKCQFCQVSITLPPQDIETRQNFAEFISESFVSTEDCIAICNRIGQKIPEGVNIPRGGRTRDRKQPTLQ